MTNPWSRWTTLLITFAGVLLPWLFNRRPPVASDATVQAVTFLPAPYASIIWAPIYTGFLLFAVWQALPAQQHNPRVAAARPWLALTAILNCTWLWAIARHRPVWSIVLVVLMLLVALVLHRALRIGRVPVEPREAWLRVPFSLYAGWLTIVLFVTTSIALVRLGWDGFGWSPVTWGILLIVASSALGLLLRFDLDDPVYGGALVWGYLAIVVQQQQLPLVALFAGIAAALCLLSLFIRDRKAPHAASSECAEV